MMKTLVLVIACSCIYAGVCDAMPDTATAEESDLESLLERFADARVLNGMPGGPGVKLGGKPKPNSVQFRIRFKCIRAIREFLTDQGEDTCELDVTRSVVQCILTTTRKYMVKQAPVEDSVGDFIENLECEETDEEDDDDEDMRGLQLQTRKRGRIWGKIVKGLKIAAKIIQIIWG